MEALQAASLLCETCPEAAATDSALCRAEQLMSETIKKVRLTLRLAVILKQQQQQQQQQQHQPWVCWGQAVDVLPAAAGAAAMNFTEAAAAAPAGLYCDPSTADSACSGYAGLPALPQLVPVRKRVCSTHMLVEQQQDAAQSAHQAAELQEEVASSWE
jgi:hypothetical protein